MSSSNSRGERRARSDDGVGVPGSTPAVASSKVSFADITGGHKNTLQPPRTRDDSANVCITGGGEVRQPELLTHRPATSTRRAVKRNDTGSTTTSSKKSGGLLSDVIHIGRVESPGENLLLPAVYSAIKEKRAAGHRESPSAPRRTAKEYIAGLASIGRSGSATSGEGDFFTAAASLVHDKQRYYMKKRAARNPTDVHERVAADPPTDLAPLWREHARAAEYQQAISGVAVDFGSLHSHTPGQSSPRQSGSTRRSESTGASDQAHRVSDNTLYSATWEPQQPSIASHPETGIRDHALEYKRSLPKGRIEPVDFADITTATALLGSKLKTKINEYGEKRNLRNQMKKAEVAEERRNRIRAAISRPIEASDGSPPSVWSLPPANTEPRLGVESQLPVSSRSEHPRQHRRMDSAVANIKTSSTEHSQLGPTVPRLSGSPKSKHQTQDTTFSAFISVQHMPDEAPPLPPIPQHKSDRAKSKPTTAIDGHKGDLATSLGHKLDGMTTTLRSRMAHLPHLHRAGSEESFVCIGTDMNGHGAPIRLQLQPEPQGRPETGTYTDIISAYGAPTPGFEQLPGPYKQMREKNDGMHGRGTARREPKRDTITDIRAAQTVAMMPEGLGSGSYDSMVNRGSQSGPTEGEEMHGGRALAASSSLHEDDPSARGKGRADSMLHTNDAAWLPKGPSSGQPRDTAYVSVYNRGDAGGIHVQGRISPLSSTVAGISVKRRSVNPIFRLV